MLTRRFFFLPLALLLVACGKPAESPPPAASAPETGPVVAVDSAPEGACPWAIAVDDEGAAQVEPDPGMGAGQVVWQGALNDDGAEDLLLRFPEGCGNYGECPYALYVACPGEPAGRYREVREPDYAMDVQMGTRVTTAGGPSCGCSGKATGCAKNPWPTPTVGTARPRLQTDVTAPGTTPGGSSCPPCTGARRLPYVPFVDFDPAAQIDAAVAIRHQ
jgi:hypothetical protein